MLQKHIGNDEREPEVSGRHEMKAVSVCSTRPTTLKGADAKSLATSNGHVMGPAILRWVQFQASLLILSTHLHARETFIVAKRIKQSASARRLPSVRNQSTNSHDLAV